MSNNSDWYIQGWSLDIMNQSWTESTVAQVDFIIDKMKLKGHERILDLACGYGRHAIGILNYPLCLLSSYNKSNVDLHPTIRETQV